MAKKTISRVIMVAGDICLYGTQQHGAGWLAQSVMHPGKILGDGEPRPGRSFTEAVWQACAALREAGAEGERVWVYASGGKLMAGTSIENPGRFGDLEWHQATVHTFSVEQILAAAAASETTAK